MPSVVRLVPGAIGRARSGAADVRAVWRDVRRATLRVPSIVAPPGRARITVVVPDAQRVGRFTGEAQESSEPTTLAPAAASCS